jgi:tRNA pseudouridine38-40 synthase
MTRFRLLVEYQGTRYGGWQVQKNARTVQGEIQQAIRTVCGTDTFELYGSGRTDAGVHALRQVAHLELDTSVPPDTLRRRLNELLPPDIHILELQPTHPRFHARHHAVARSYLYQISRRRTAFGKPLVWWVKDRLDVRRMEQAAALFAGLKDYRSFCAGRLEQGSTRVLVDRVVVQEAGDLILIRVEGSHFLWRMVRRIVGVLVEAGRGRLAPDEIEGFFRVKSDLPARLAAPASGLFLERVYYEGDERLRDLDPVIRVVSEPGRVEEGDLRHGDNGVTS